MDGTTIVYCPEHQDVFDAGLNFMVEEYQAGLEAEEAFQKWVAEQEFLTEGYVDSLEELPF